MGSWYERAMLIRIIVMNIFTEKIEWNHTTSVRKCLNSRWQFITDLITVPFLYFLDNPQTQSRKTIQDIAAICNAWTNNRFINSGTTQEKHHLTLVLSFHFMCVQIIKLSKHNNLLSWRLAPAILL